MATTLQKSSNVIFCFHPFPQSTGVSGGEWLGIGCEDLLSPAAGVSLV
jgi:hypothetical protein